MTKITLDQIKELRQLSGAPVMECRQALSEADGVIKKAVDILKKKGIDRAEKKAIRETKAGLVEAYAHTTGKIGVLVELACETDFVARNEEFKNLAHELCLQIASMTPKNVEELLKQEYIRDPQIKVGDLVKQAIGKIGENIIVQRFERFELGV